MKITTLTYIYNLLIENEARLKAETDKAREAKDKAFEAIADNLPALEEAYMRAYKAWNDAHNELSNFKLHDFR